MSKISLQNKVMVVTGGSGGIGYEIIKTLAAFKAKVISAYHNNLPIYNSEYVTWVKSDLTQSSEWDKLLYYTKNKFDKIDVLINCVGILQPGEFTLLDNSQINKMIDLNLTSVLTGIHKTLAIMKYQKFGHIINIGSLGGIVPMPYSAVYSATKFALRGFTLSIAQEYKGTGIRISLLTTDSVETKMLDRESENSRPTISFYNDPLPPQLIATEIVKIIGKPKVEKIIKGYNKIPAIVLGSFPSLFQFIYPFIENRSGKKKEKHIERKKLEIK